MGNEKRLIDRNEIFPNGVFFANAEDPIKSLDELIKRIWSIPTVDAVEVVRCKDCKYEKTCSILWESKEPKENGYCSLGERKDNADNR